MFLQDIKKQFFDLAEAKLTSAFAPAIVLKRLQDRLYLAVVVSVSYHIRL